MEFLSNIYLANLNVNCSIGGLFSIGKEEKWQYGTNACMQNKFYYILDGNCLINIEGKDYFGSAGTWFLIPAKTKHFYYNIQDTPFQKLWLHFDVETGSGPLCHMLNLPYCINIGINKKISALFCEILRLRAETHVTSVLKQKARMMDLISEYIAISQADKITLSDENDTCIANILKYINDNLCKKHTNDELAKIAHMHPTNFIKFFKLKTGITPKKYINMRRMEYAKELLESTNMSATEILQLIGMEDSAHFTKLFKSFYDISPTNYRKLYLNNRPMMQLKSSNRTVR